MASERLAILFDIDGTLITTGGADAASWRMAFDDLHGIPADIGEFTDTGMTDPEVGRRTFEAVLHRVPEPRGSRLDDQRADWGRANREIATRREAAAVRSCRRGWRSRATC